VVLHSHRRSPVWTWPGFIICSTRWGLQSRRTASEPAATRTSGSKFFPTETLVALAWCVCVCVCAREAGFHQFAKTLAMSSLLTCLRLLKAPFIVPNTSSICFFGRSHRRVDDCASTYSGLPGVCRTVGF